MRINIFLDTGNSFFFPSFFSSSSTLVNNVLYPEKCVFRIREDAMTRYAIIIVQLWNAIKTIPNIEIESLVQNFMNTYSITRNKQFYFSYR